jgi:hypothetical protein
MGAFVKIIIEIWNSPLFILCIPSAQYGTEFLEEFFKPYLASLIVTSKWQCA